MKFSVFQCVPTALVLLLDTIEKSLVPSSLLLHQIFIHLGKIPFSLLCSRMNNPSSLSLSSYDRLSKPIITFVTLH